MNKSDNYHQRLFLAVWYSIWDANAHNDHIEIPDVYKSLFNTVYTQLHNLDLFKSVSTFNIFLTDEDRYNIYIYINLPLLITGVGTTVGDSFISNVSVVVTVS